MEVELKDMKTAKEGFETAASQAKSLIAKYNKETSLLRGKLKSANEDIAKIQKEHKEVTDKLQTDHKELTEKLAKQSAKSSSLTELENVKRNLVNEQSRSTKLTGFLRTIKKNHQTKLEEFKTFQETTLKDKESQEKLVKKLMEEISMLKEASKVTTGVDRTTDDKTTGKGDKIVDKRSRTSVATTSSEKMAIEKAGISPGNKPKEDFIPKTSQENVYINNAKSATSKEIILPKQAGSKKISSLKTVIDNSVPKFPEEGFTFSGGIAGDSLPTIDEGKANTGAVPAPPVISRSESSLRAKLLRKRKMKSGTGGNALKEGLEQKEAIEPAPKRERSEAASHTSQEPSDDKKVVEVKKESDPIESSPFLDIKIPTNQSTTLSFGFSTNIKLPVPSGAKSTTSKLLSFGSKLTKVASEGNEGSSKDSGKQVAPDGATKAVAEDNSECEKKD